MTLVAITGSDVPYLYDLPQFQALPEGFEYRFRYKRTWVAPKVIESVKACAKNYVGQEVFLVFHSKIRKALIPLRFARVAAIELLGSIVFVRFRVSKFACIADEMLHSRGHLEPPAEGSDPKAASIDDFLRVANRKENREAVIAEVTKHLSAKLGITTDLGFGLGNGRYLFETTDPINIRPSASSSNVEKSQDWARIAALLHDEPGLAGIPMFYLLGFQEVLSSTWIQPERVPRFRFWRRNRVSGYRITEGKRATLRVLLSREKGAGDLPVFRANPVLAGSLLRLEGAANLVVGKYDVLEFTVEASRAGIGELGLRVESEKPDGKTWPQVLAARVPVQVVASAWKTAEIYLLGLIGIGLLVFADQLLGLFTSTPGNLALGIRGLGLMLLPLAISKQFDRFAKFTSNFQKISGLQGTNVSAVSDD
jgi:hypothetical protein